MIYFVWRLAAQAVVGYALTALAAGGVTLDRLQAWGVTVDREALTAAVFAVGIAGYGAAVHWLETRTGDGLFAKACRGLARLLLLGAGKAPVYVKPQEKVRVTAPNGDTALVRDRLKP